MNDSRRRMLSLLAAIAALFLAALAVDHMVFPAGSQGPSPADTVQQAWQRARDLGTYSFATDLTATAYAAPKLANTGRPASEERLHLEGSVDVPADTLLLSVWQGSGSVLNPRDGVEVRIEGNRAYGRAVRRASGRRSTTFRAALRRAATCWSTWRGPRTSSSWAPRGASCRRSVDASGPERGAGPAGGGRL